MTIESIITIITLACGLVGAISALIPTLVNSVKRLKELVKNKDWNTIKNIAKAAMAKAEETGKTGAEKKQMVIDAVAAGCEEAGIELDENLVKDLADYIDESIAYVNDMVKLAKEAKKAAKKAK